MTLPVHLVPSLAGVAPGAVVTVEGDEAHHAVVVRRLRAGESVVLTDGAGRSVTGEVVSTGKRVFEVAADRVEDSPRPEPVLVVVQALPKGDRGELAVEVLTEIGADVIVPWAAERCVAVWRGERAEKSLAKWRATAREAAKQARRTWHPVVEPLAATADVAALVGESDLTLVLHEEASAPLADLLTGSDEAPEVIATARRIVVVVGPEGGLTDAEVATLTAAGGHGVRLGPEVLRTSTAGLAALAALLPHTARWR